MPKEKRTKWDTHVEDGVLVGFSEMSKSYRILHQPTNRVTISRSDVFDEGSGTFDKSELVQADVGQSLQSPDPVPDVPQV